MAEFTHKPVSGKYTATGTASVISASEKQLQSGIWIQVRTGDATAEVIAAGQTEGINVTAGTEKFFPCDSFNDVLVKGSDDIYYWAF